MLGLLQSIIEVDEVVHEVADRVEDYILSHNLRNPHHFLSLGLLRLVFVLAVRTPEVSLD